MDHRNEKVIHLKGSALDDQLRKTLQKLQEDGDLADMTLSTSDREFKVHKFLLKAHTEYFDNDLLRQDSVSVNLNSCILEQVLIFLYHGHLSVELNNLTELAKAADEWGVDCLKKQCKFALLADAVIESKNCLEIWVAAFQVNEEVRSSEALNVALEHFQELQYDRSFTQLPFECILTYLSHPDLNVNSPDERLAAALSWITSDTKARAGYFCDILKTLPLKDMQGWYLKQILHSPLVKANPSASPCLGELLKTTQITDCSTKPSEQVKVENTKDTKNPSILPKCALESHVPYLIAIGMVEPSQYRSGELWAFTLDTDIRAISVGAVRISRDSGGMMTFPVCKYSMCVHGLDVFICMAPTNQVHLLHYKLYDKSCKLLESWQCGRRIMPALCCKSECLYIFGAQSSRLKVYKSQGTTFQQMHSGSRYYERASTCTWRPEESEVSFACCDVNDGEHIIFYASTWDSEAKTGGYYDRHSHVYLYSTEKKGNVCSVEIPRICNGPVYKVLLIDGDRFLLVAEYYTAVCSLQAIRQSREDWCTFRDRYIIPNSGCAITLSANNEYVMILGGTPKMFQPKHYSYRASVRSIVENTGKGWTKTRYDMPIGGFKFGAFDTVSLPSDQFN